MKPCFYLFLLAISTLLALCTSCKEQDEKTLVNKYLQQAIDACNKYNTIAYNEIDINEEGGVDTVSVYFEKNPADTAIGFKFLALTNESQTVYAGSELFTIGLKDYTDYYVRKNEFAVVDENFTKPFPQVRGYTNSLYAYANTFKLVLNDSTVVKTLLNDTTINGLECRQVKLHFNNKRMFGDEYHDFPENLKIFFDYTFFIDKKDHLLRQLTLSSSFGSPPIAQYVDYVFDQPRSDIKWNLQDYEGLTRYEHVEYELELLDKGESMPAFNAKLLDGEDISQSYLKGKLSLLFFFSPGCGVGKMTYPLVNRLVEKYPEITILGINIKKIEEDKLRKYKEKEDFKFAVAQGEKELPAAFRVDASPTILIFNKKGIAVHSVDGYYDKLEEDLEKVINDIK